MYGKFLHHIDQLHRGTPITMNLHITNRCNMRCGHCIYYGNARTDAYIPSDELSGTQCCNIISRFADAGGMAVEVTGGEPTIHPDFQWVTGFIDDSGLDWGLKTNGTRLDNIVGCPTWVRISVDAASADTYNVVHGCGIDTRDYLFSISNLVTRLSLTTVGVSYLIMPGNYREIGEFARIMRDVGVSYVRYSYALLPGGSSIYDDMRKSINDLCEVAMGYSTDNYEVIVEDYKLDTMNANDRSYSRCYYSEHMIVVGADGWQYPCCELSYITRYRIHDALAGDFSHVPIDAQDCPPCDMDWKNEVIHSILDDYSSTRHWGFI